MKRGEPEICKTTFKLTRLHVLANEQVLVWMKFASHNLKEKVLEKHFGIFFSVIIIFLNL